MLHEHAASFTHTQILRTAHALHRDRLVEVALRHIRVLLHLSLDLMDHLLEQVQIIDTLLPNEHTSLLWSVLLHFRLL